MKAEVTPAAGSVEGVVWDVLGQTYVPKSRCESSTSWHATLPAGTFVPPHIHPGQDEFVYILTGELEYILDGKEGVAKPGDMLCMPKGIPHGLFNRSGAEVTTLFWVSPSDKIWELFCTLDGMSDPEAVVKASAECNVDFLPPAE
ncbi:cupin domain-containing protein [Rhodovulum sp. DZ06]|uniref:cupin domain-containing protein n=1 Tax=Rhodovulum sp. DZ06 TaxID=3425126 RepID=UPI003D32F91F